MNYVEIVERALARLASSNLASGGMEGVGAEALRAAVGSASGLVSPSYSTFMGALGRNAGQFLSGSEILIGNLRELQELGTEVRDEEGEVFARTAPQMLVFAGHQGYQFLFVDEPGDAAPVYRYLEGEGVSRVADSFAEWFASAVEDEIRVAGEVSAPSTSPTDAG